MRLCAAQLRSVAGDVATNRDRHRELIDLAAHERADVVFFPELSLTGYEPSLARSLATDVADSRLEPFQELSDAHAMVVGVGVPLAAGSRVQIGMVWFTPNAPRQTYAKQVLHADERPTFVPGARQLLLDVGGRRLAPAICYESLQMRHADRAAARSADTYLASVAKGAPNLAAAMAHYPEVARRHGMHVIMSNCVGPSDGVTCVGQSAAWDDRGALLAQLGRETEGLVMLDTVARTARVHELGAARVRQSPVTGSRQSRVTGDG
jgi:predicted amidohydrolase